MGSVVIGVVGFVKDNHRVRGLTQERACISAETIRTAIKEFIGESLVSETTSNPANRSHGHVGTAKKSTLIGPSKTNKQHHGSSHARTLKREQAPASHQDMIGG